MRPQHLSRIPFILFRSGTSRGFLIQKSEVPLNLSIDECVLRMMGSGQTQMVGGFGGNSSVTSKACVISIPSKSSTSLPNDIDICYHFRQCGTKNFQIDNSHGDCGNMIASIAPYAIHKNLVSPNINGPTTTIKVYSESTKTIFVLEVETNKNGEINYTRHDSPENVFEGGTKVNIFTLSPQGTTLGKMFPTNNVSDEIDGIEVTCIDVSRPMILVSAKSLKLNGNEEIELLSSNNELMEKLEYIRLEGAKKMGMGDVSGRVSPKMAIISSPTNNSNSTLQVRYIVSPFNKEMHPTIAMTAAQCISSACLVPGTVPFKESNQSSIQSKEYSDLVEFKLQLQHPIGVVNILVCLKKIRTNNYLSKDGNELIKTGYTRTVSLLADGFAYV